MANSEIDSALIYDFADIRDLIKKHHIADLFGNSKYRGGELVEFVRPELIVTQKSSEDSVESTYLKHPITFDAMLKFFELNRHLIYQHRHDFRLRPKEDRGKDPADIDKLTVEKSIEAYTRKYNAEIVEVDDEYPDELLFSIVLNR